MSTKKYTTREVFGIKRDLPLNYVERPSADKMLLDNLTRDKHLVIFGSSKQGKTSLRKHSLKDDEYIVIHCSNKWNVSDINNAILKRAGFELTQSTSKTISGKSKIFAKISTAIFGNSAEGGAEHEKTQTNQVNQAPLELDPEDVNDVISALKSINFDKYIVLEDFHYLGAEAQKDFAVTLKAFHEESPFCFIIVGVWLEENRLTVYNGDLSGRVYSIDADKWMDSELEAVISKGEQLLGITFGSEFKSELLLNCYGSVSVVQETCYHCCERYAVQNTLDNNLVIGTREDADQLVDLVVSQQSGRFNSFIIHFADGFQATTLEMHKWLLFPILTSEIDDLKRGLKYNEIKNILENNHPQKSDLNPGNVTQALQSCASLQVKKDMKPIIVDYDSTNRRLNVVDSSFLIWLDKQDRQELLKLAGFTD